jgi:hypothetical protein
MDRTASIRDRTVQRRLRALRALPFAIVRRRVLLIAVLAVAGCGGSEQRENRLRPPVPVTLTGAIHKDGLQISPASVGAGTIVLIVSNQSGKPQKVTFETDELGGKTAGRQASSPVIAPSTTGRLTIEARQGTYSVHVADDTIRAARVFVGPPRESAQDDLLLP